MLPCGGLNSLLTPGELGVNSRCGDIDLFVWVQSTSTLYLPRCHVAGSCVVAITQIMHFVAPVNSQCNPGELDANSSVVISTYLSSVGSVCFDFYTCHVATLRACVVAITQIML